MKKIDTQFKEVAKLIQESKNNTLCLVNKALVALYWQRRIH